VKRQGRGHGSSGPAPRKDTFVRGAMDNEVVRWALPLTVRPFKQFVRHRSHWHTDETVVETAMTVSIGDFEGGGHVTLIDGGHRLTKPLEGTRFSQVYQRTHPVIVYNIPGTTRHTRTHPAEHPQYAMDIPGVLEPIRAHPPLRRYPYTPGQPGSLEYYLDWKTHDTHGRLLFCNMKDLHMSDSFQLLYPAAHRFEIWFVTRSRL
jgi:hypothetical protein